jgi:hypothetical protein
LICLGKTKRMEVENKAKASKYTEPPAGKGIICICLVKTKRMGVENKAKASKYAEPPAGKEII